MPRSKVFRFSFVFLFVLLPALVSAALPTGFTEFPVVTGLSTPTAMAFAPDGRLFVCQQGGALRVIKDGALLPTPFVTLTVDSSNERGLLGVAFDPDFATNQWIYVYYTATTPTVHSRVSRFTASGDVAAPDSEVVILDVPTAAGTNHQGGALRFSVDGKLLVVLGDNGPSSNAQTLANLHGKLLRLNRDGSIPADNPFVNTASGINRAIWAYGLRNPFTFDVQPGTGRILLNDVGQLSWEEVNDGFAGANYGWPTTEGYFNAAQFPQFRNPTYAYSSSGADCAIVGAAFYNPARVNFPAEYVGRYFFGDLCGNWIDMLDPAAGNTITRFATSLVSQLVDLETGPDGSLYYLSRTNGTVRRIAYTAGTAPVITSHPQSVVAPLNDPVSFAVSASGTAPFTYQWQRNGSDIPGATAATYAIARVGAADNGAQFRCRVSNSFGSTDSNPATLIVTGNARPLAVIVTPAAGSLFSGGDVIGFSGTATDAEDGVLPASRFTWRVDLHHDEHTHPHMAATTGITGGSVTAAVSETAATIWLRIHLTVADSGGLTHSVYRDVLPRVARLTLATIPSGLQVSVDGQSAQTAPYAFDGVAGVTRTLGVAPTQTLGTSTYSFAGWSDGGAVAHDISTPAASTTFTATFHCLSPANPAAFVPQYRLYHDGTKEHLYTTDAHEYGVLGTRSWQQEGVAYRIFSTPGVHGTLCTVPFYRLYHSPSLQHHWTTDAHEVSVLSTLPGWAYEGIAGYILPGQVSGSVPLFRLMYPNPVVHLWTTDATERQILITRYGWVDEGIAGYVVP